MSPPQNLWAGGGKIIPPQSRLEAARTVEFNLAALKQKTPQNLCGVFWMVLKLRRKTS
jgi:hypothetical protein